MLNGEIWLAPAKHDWRIHINSWAKDLGWFSRFRKILWAAERGEWLSTADVDNSEILDIVIAPDAHKKLYRKKDGNWEHLPGPVLFVTHGKIAGYGGPHEMMEHLEGNFDPWKWTGIQIVEVDPTVTTVVNVSKNDNIFQNFNKTKSLIDGWMTWSVANPDASTVQAIEEGVVVKKLAEGVWMLNTKEFSLANIRLSTGYNLKDLRAALSECECHYAWVSDQRDWPGWLPDNDQINSIHVWPDKYEQFGSELLVPVDRLFKETKATDLTLNDFPDLVFHDKRI